jgi:hypothetical protein
MPTAYDELRQASIKFLWQVKGMRQSWRVIPKYFHGYFCCLRIYCVISIYWIFAVFVFIKSRRHPFFVSNLFAQLIIFQYSTLDIGRSTFIMFQGGYALDFELKYI